MYRGWSGPNFPPENLIIRSFEGWQRDGDIKPIFLKKKSLPPSPLFIPEDTLALILLHVLLVRVPGKCLIKSNSLLIANLSRQVQQLFIIPFSVIPISSSKPLYSLCNSHQWWAPNFGALVCSPLAPPRTRPKEGTFLNSPEHFSQVITPAKVEKGRCPISSSSPSALSSLAS